MVDYVSYGGWKNNLRLANRQVELIVTLDVGPRVISYRTNEGANVFKNYDEQMGGTDEAEWKIRGGHRFWLAPEDKLLSYIPDNRPVEHRRISENEFEFGRPASSRSAIEMTLIVGLDEESAGVRVTHRATNKGTAPQRLATWGLSVLAPGGIEIIPLPPVGEHPRDLLPERRMILWPYTNMADPRWRWGKRFITLRQRAETAPTKLGLTHREGWAAYQLGTQLFVKSIPFTEEADYADLGCNFETFSNHEMLELEALGPLVTLGAGATTSHTERWHLFPIDRAIPDLTDEQALTEWLEPFLDRAGLKPPERRS